MAFLQYNKCQRSLLCTYFTFGIGIISLQLQNYFEKLQSFIFIKNSSFEFHLET